MNKSAEIKIETPVGETEPIHIYEVVMQGTVLAALICANMIDTVTDYKKCWRWNQIWKNKDNITDIPR